jgi:hypothetical protein
MTAAAAFGANPQKTAGDEDDECHTTSRATILATSHAASPATTETEPGDNGSADGLHEDRLAYLTDMIRELQVIAHESQLETLTGILGLAHSEARQKLQKKRA